MRSFFGNNSDLLLVYKMDTEHVVQLRWEDWQSGSSISSGAQCTKCEQNRM